MNESDIPFTIPEQLVSKIYELSGGCDKYKGVILAVVSEDGDPMVYSKFDSAIVEIGLTKAMKDWVTMFDKQEKGDIDDL